MTGNENTVLHVRLKQGEKMAIREAADRCKLTLSEFVRQGLQIAAQEINKKAA